MASNDPANPAKPGIADRIKHALHLDKDSTASEGNAAPTANQSTSTSTGPATGSVPGTGPSDVGAASTGATNGTTSTTTDQRVLSSSSGQQNFNEVSDVKSSADLLSSDAHWEKAQAATEEARRQAAIVEATARSHREAYEEYYKAERHLVKSRNSVEEIETRIRGIDISGKQAEADRAREAYNAEKERLRKLAADADAARSKADAAQDDINARGRELESRVAESKLHSDRLGQLQQEIDRLRGAEEDAKRRHTDHLALLTPLREKHAHHKSERDRVADELARLKAELDGLRGKEGETQRSLDGLTTNISALEAEIGDSDGRRKEKEAALLARKNDLDGIARKHAELEALLGSQRQKVGEMTKDTQQAMANAQAQADDADRKVADLQQAEGLVQQHEGAVAGAREALADTAAQQRQLDAAGRAAAVDVETHAQRASALQAELQAAKERMDLAQAKKEELWELSKKHGGMADEASDVHYVEHVAKPAGIDASELTSKTDTTADLAGKITYADNAIDHQQSAALDAQRPAATAV